MWEKKLRQIEKGEYDPKLFLDEMKEMVSLLVSEVKRENKKSISIEQEIKQEEKNPVKAEKPKPEKEKKPATKKEVKEPLQPKAITCPKCKKGAMLKGKTAFGCSEYKSGCTFKVMFEYYGATLTEKQIYAIIEKGKTSKIIGLSVDGQLIDSTLILNSSFNVVLEQAKGKAIPVAEEHLLF